MSNGIKHAKQSGLPADGGDTSVVQPTDWYAEHTGGLQSATVTLTSAEILALVETPVELVASPGAGHWLLVFKVVTSLGFGTVPYAIVDGSPSIVYQGGIGLVADVAVLVGSQSITATYTPDLTGQDLPDDLPIIIRGGDSNLIDGDSTLTVTVWYEDVAA